MVLQVHGECLVPGKAKTRSSKAFLSERKSVENAPLPSNSLHMEIRQQKYWDPVYGGIM